MHHRSGQEARFSALSVQTHHLGRDDVNIMTNSPPVAYLHLMTNNSQTRRPGHHHDAKSRVFSAAYALMREDELEEGADCMSRNMTLTNDDGLDLVAWAVVRKHVHTGHTGTVPGAMTMPKSLTTIRISMYVEKKAE